MPEATPDVPPVDLTAEEREALDDFLPFPVTSAEFRLLCAAVARIVAARVAAERAEWAGRVEALADEWEQREIDPWYWSEPADELRALVQPAATEPGTAGEQAGHTWRTVGPNAAELRTQCSTCGADKHSTQGRLSCPSTAPQPEPAARTTCLVAVWDDGIYRTRCSMGTRGVCAKHGPHKPHPSDGRECTPNEHDGFCHTHGVYMDPYAASPSAAAAPSEGERPYCLRCTVAIYRDEKGVWRREATGSPVCPRNPAGDGHEPLPAAPSVPTEDRADAVIEAIEETFLSQLPSAATALCAQEDVNAGLDALRERFETAEWRRSEQR